MREKYGSWRSPRRQGSLYSNSLGGAVNQLSAKYSYKWENERGMTWRCALSLKMVQFFCFAFMHEAKLDLLRGTLLMYPASTCSKLLWTWSFGKYSNAGMIIAVLLMFRKDSGISMRRSYRYSFCHSHSRITRRKKINIVIEEVCGFNVVNGKISQLIHRKWFAFTILIQHNLKSSWRREAKYIICIFQVSLIIPGREGQHCNNSSAPTTENVSKERDPVLPRWKSG